MYCEDVFPGWVNRKQNGGFIGSKPERGVIAYVVILVILI